MWIIFILLGLILLGCGCVAILFFPRKERPRTKLPRIVCIGDSITFGMGVFKTRHRDAWPYLLRRKLSGRWEVLNYGISGATLQREGNQPYRESFWEAAKKCRGQVYLLMLGTNDSKPQNWDEERYLRELQERALALRALPSAPTVILMSPPPAYKQQETDAYAAFDIDDGVCNRLQELVRQVAEENDLGFINLYQPMTGHPEYMGDGVHPNRLGNRVMAEHILRELEKETGSIHL